MRKHTLAVLLAAGIGAAAGCTQTAPPAPTAIKGAPAVTATGVQTDLTGRTNSFAVLASPGKSIPSAGPIPFYIQHPVEFPLNQVGPLAVIFPPRNEPNLFFGDLQALYRDQLHRTQTAPSYVDPEGENVWLTEYFRFSLNGCTHDQAVQRTLLEITTGGQQATCGAETPTFPPRDLPNLFQMQLEATYRDVLRRPLLFSYVDTEGANVWLAEYLRYRVVGGCDHPTAESKVFTQILGGGIQPVCTNPLPPPPPPPPPPTPLTGSISVSNTPCIAPSTGNVSCTFVASASGDQPPYTFAWTFINPANGLVIPATGQNVSPALGCNISSGVATYNLNISLIITAASGHTTTVPGSQQIGRRAGDCGT
jgi:hypothetical protein